MCASSSGEEASTWPECPTSRSRSGSNYGKGATGAGLLVAVSDRSFFDTFKEASSLAKHVAGARADASQLVRDLASERPGVTA